ncbi:ABC transporter substrate-binding protein [Deinococcus marmoris]|uniref:ABC transporter, periplasmic spermidine putrescine-binding protein PotD n=1 Tax=Deinococcus marmoris TaxID=249408 RepID=A0A1U7NVK9_9DEIO|nr:ABC transporter substrate-binding protein [Deinococcus marmoris]OLV16946.1 ABC transporter, periplasmic spermidine putrescine-binding protein PotD [Deinococcus marmoris]
MKTPRHVRLLFTLLPLSLAAAQAQKTTLVVSGFGIAQDKIEKNIAKPFEAVCGCNVVFEVGNNADRLAKLTARKANPNVDVVLLADYFAKQASNQGLFEKLDTAQLSNYGKLYDFARDPLKDGTAVAFTVYSVSIVYRTDKITKPITSWKDLWRPELAGKVALPNITTTQGPPTVWLVNRAYGGKDSDASAAFGQLGKLKVLTYYNQSSQVTSLFAQDEIWAAPVGRFAWGGLLNTKKPLAWARLSDGQAGLVNVASVVKGSKNVALAHKFIDFMLSTPVQTAQALDLVDSPVNKQVKLPAAVANQLTVGVSQVAGLRFMDTSYVLTNRDNWIQRWNREVVK